MTLTQTLRVAFAPPHRAGWPFIAVSVVLALVGLLLTRWLFWPAAILTVFCLYFFRDPERTPPRRAGAVVAPADGRVVSVSLAVPPPELGLGPEPRWRVAIFLSVLNVHVNRAPASGVVTRVAYRPGAFVSASLDKASEKNERNAIALALPSKQTMAVVQIAGLIARRIPDLYLPAGVLPLVVEGQTMIGGESVIAELEQVQADSGAAVHRYSAAAQA